MTARPRIDVRRRQARLVRRHLLHPDVQVDEPAGAVDALVALHATDPASVYLSARARVHGFQVASLEAALYEDRSLVKHLGMRRTVFVVRRELVAVVQAACTDGVAAVQRRNLIRDLEASGVADDGARWLEEARRATLAALDTMGEATGSQLSKTVPALQAKLPGAAVSGAPVEVGVASRTLTVLAAEGDLVRGRPQGSWTSSQHRWRRGAPTEPMSVDVATGTLVARWLRAFGPGTVADLAWWTGLATGRIRRALTALDAVEVDLDVGTGFVLADDLGDLDGAADAEPLAPAPAFLPALDPTTMGWKQREHVLGDAGPKLFDRSGNAGPSIWWDGRIVGGWAQRRRPPGVGEIRWELFEDLGTEAAAAVAAEAAALQSWLGATVVSSRFPTPLERTLRE